MTVSEPKPLRKDDLLIPQGATWEMHWPIQNTDKSDADLSGWDARSQVRASRSDDTVLHEFDASVSGSDVVLKVSAAESSAWDWRQGVYDVELFKDEAVVRVVRVTQGTITVDLETTRD